MRQEVVFETYKNLTHDQRRTIDQEILRQKYRESLMAVAKVLCGYKDVTENTHGAIIKALEAPTNRKLIVCPRGAFKSSLAVVSYAIWVLINNPNARILIDSEVFTNSKNFIKTIKGHIESFRFRGVFGNWKGEDWPSGSLTVRARTANLKEPSVLAGGVGTIKTGLHFDYILADDLNSQKNSGTPENAQKVLDHYRYYTSLLDPGGTIVVVGTRYSQLDVIQNILDTEVNGQ